MRGRRFEHLVRPEVLPLVPYEHGRPVEEVRRELGLERVFKLASNENPWGPPERVIKALLSADLVEALRMYPDGAARALRERIAERLGLTADWIALGNGSDELIHFIGLVFLRPGDEVVVGHPSFVRYYASAQLNGAKLVKVPLKDYRLDLPSMAEAITERTKLVFIANPNNPTGTMVTADEVEEFMRKVPRDVVVIFDEAYCSFVDDPDFPDTLPYVKEGERPVIVLRTFSKDYGLAGLRVGYGVMPPEIREYVDKVREPFNVNSLAQLAALTALEDEGYVEWVRRRNAEGKQYLYRELRRLGLSYVPTQANFMLVDVGRPAREVFEALLRRGVIVRPADSFGYPTHIRVTIGRPEENRAFIKALEEVLKEVKQ